MLILTIRTDKPEAELGLYDGVKQRAYHAWEAHRQLAETIHLEIKKLLESEGKKLADLEAITVYGGPGSFTGLRIGISVANALAEGLQLPIASATGDDWINLACQSIRAGHDQRLVIPDYGSPPHITLPKH